MEKNGLCILIADDDASHSTPIRLRLEQDYPDARIEVIPSLGEYRDRVAAASTGQLAAGVAHEINPLGKRYVTATKGVDFSFTPSG